MYEMYKMLSNKNLIKRYNKLKQELFVKDRNNDESIKYEIYKKMITIKYILIEERKITWFD